MQIQDMFTYYHSVSTHRNTKKRENLSLYVFLVVSMFCTHLYDSVSHQNLLNTSNSIPVCMDLPQRNTLHCFCKGWEYKDLG